MWRCANFGRKHGGYWQWSGAISSRFSAAAGATPAMLCPRATRAQQASRMRRIGVLMAYAKSDPEGQGSVAAFREGLQKLGWAQDRNIGIDIRWAIPTDAEAIQRFAKELVDLQPDLILTTRPRRCCNRHAPSPLSSRRSAIRSAAGSPLVGSFTQNEGIHVWLYQ
jgi:hypothetical protein